jgi:hypothetical protein
MLYTCGKKEITMKMSKALQQVKKYLRTGEAGIPIHRDGKSYFLCYAAGEAYIKGKITWRVKELAKVLFLDRLSDCNSLEEWLDFHHGVAVVYYGDEKYTAFRNKMQRTRHAWIDSMIAEFKANGN